MKIKISKLCILIDQVFGMLKKRVVVNELKIKKQDTKQQIHTKTTKKHKLNKQKPNSRTKFN